MSQAISDSPSLASQIGQASMVIMIWSMADKILAVVKEILTAHRFGVSSDLDVFNIAYSFPGIIVLLFSGALVSAFVPLYLEWINRTSARDADSHATWLIYITTVFFAFLTLICYFLSPAIIAALGYGFGPAEKQLGIAMERLLVMLILIDGAGIIFRGILHARKMFFHLYVAPIFVNLTLILLLSFDTGIGIYALVWGFLIGTLLKTLYMVIALRGRGFHFGTTLPYDRQKMKVLWLLVLPMIGSQLISNSNLLVDQVMATSLPSGSVSTLRYAFRINDLPIQVIIMAISRAIFPFISEEAAAGNRENLKKIYKYSLIFLGFLTIPMTCMIVLFSEDIVTVLLKRGAFDLEATRETAQALTCFSLGLFFYAYTFVNGSFFAALQDTKTLFYMGIVSIILNALFNFIFMNIIGVQGIALSTSVTMCIISIWFIFLLKKRLGLYDLQPILSSFYRLIMAAVCMLAVGFLSVKIFQVALIDRWVYFPVSAILAAVVYLWVVWAFRTDDLQSCMDMFMRMLSSINKKILGRKGEK